MDGYPLTLYFSWAFVFFDESIFATFISPFNIEPNLVHSGANFLQ
jgi:hypothetical protein